MFLQIMSLVMNAVLGRSMGTNEPGGFFSHFTMASLRKLVMIMAGVAIGLMLFFGGAFTVLMDLILASRDHGQLMISSASVIGFVLMGLSILTLAGLFSRRLWRAPRPMTESRDAAISQVLSPVAEAVAGLIRDFAEERKQAAQMMAAMNADMNQQMIPPDVPGPVQGRPSYN